MSVALDTFNVDTCADGVANLSFRKLWEVIAVAALEGSGMTLSEILAEACADGVSQLSDRKLLEVIAESAVGGGGIGGADVFFDLDPSPPPNPSKAAISIPAGGGAWTAWPPGGPAWI
jgi:hypothetical protein